MDCGSTGKNRLEGDGKKPLPYVVCEIDCDVMEGHGISRDPKSRAVFVAAEVDVSAELLFQQAWADEVDFEGRKIKVVITIEDKAKA